MYNKAFNPDAQVLKGNVSFRHDSAFMYCDSAYLYDTSNSIEAFGNVRMEQGDTLFIYSKWLLYNGNTRQGQLRKEVKMINNNVTLLTDSLNYDRNTNIGYYFNNGTIEDEENKLSSVYGQYSVNTKLANFNDSVKVENEKFTIFSDTLNYDTSSKIATILGPSTIVSDSGTIYSSKGWYNTSSGVSLLLDRSQVVSGNRILIGDSISYDKDLGFSEVFGNMILIDTAQKVTLKGNYGYYDEKNEFAFATDSACAMEYSREDTIFIHADTLQMATIDSVYREIKAYYGVRFYRVDVQGVCDSMMYNTRDSILRMFNGPIIWNETNQLYGDTILVFMNDSSADHAHIKQFAFSVQELNPSYYNQMKGNDMVAYFEGQAIRQVDVSGNAESIFYPLDNGEMVGLNHTKSPYITIWLKEGKLDKLKIWPQPSGTLTPIPDLHPEEKTLQDFYWFDYIRPANKDDIYHKVERKEGEAPKRSNKFVH
jgi:lipopolysaccharide export system protein LptA